MEKRLTLTLKKPLPENSEKKVTLSLKLPVSGVLKEKTPIIQPKQVTIVVEPKKHKKKKALPNKKVPRFTDCIPRYPMRLPQDEKIKNAILWLVEKFPKCFSLTKPCALEVKIEKQIFKHLEGTPFTKKIIRSALHYYCSSRFYLDAVSKVKYRVGLKGGYKNTIHPQIRKDYYDKLKEIFDKSNKERVLPPLPRVPIVPPKYKVCRKYPNKKKQYKDKPVYKKKETSNASQASK